MASRYVRARSVDSCLLVQRPTCPRGQVLTRRHSCLFGGAELVKRGEPRGEPARARVEERLGGAPRNGVAGQTVAASSPGGATRRSSIATACFGQRKD
jgi:hypothetical protein